LQQRNPRNAKNKRTKKLDRLGLLPEKDAAPAAGRPRRFVFVKPVDEAAEQAKAEAMAKSNDIDIDSEDLSLDELLSAFTEEK
jgi:hypothetical protein